MMIAILVTSLVVAIIDDCQQPPDLPLSPRLVICGGGSVPAEAREQFFHMGGGERGRLVVIPTASASAETQPLEQFSKPWHDAPWASVDVLHTRSRERANEDTFAEPLSRATAVWFVGGQQSRIADAYLHTAVERELMSLVRRGGVIGGTSAGAAIQSQVMIAGGTSDPRMAKGFDLLPRTIIDQHFTQRKRQTRLHKAVDLHPECLGLGIDESTAVIVTGTKLRVVGKSNVAIFYAKTADEPTPRERTLSPGTRIDLDAIRQP